MKRRKRISAIIPEDFRSGGICPENASEYLEAGASHVIVTSYVFKSGVISWENLEKIRNAAGKEHLVLDLSCRKKDGNYYIVTDRWQKFTEEIVTLELMEKLGSYCDEFLVHAVDVEGRLMVLRQNLRNFWDSIQLIR